MAAAVYGLGIRPHPYSLLLPTQILLLAWLAIVVADQWRGSGYFWVT